MPGPASVYSEADLKHNRKRREAEARENRRREQALKNAVLVDRSALPPYVGLGMPDFLERGYYLDIPFTCASCGSDENWTAAQQKWWYEVAKGSLHSSAKLCRACRRDAREHKGKADPLQNPSGWLPRIRDALQPALLAAGWHIVNGDGPRPAMLSYARGDVLIRILWPGSGALVLEERVGRDGPFEDRVRTMGGRWFWDATPAEMRRRLSAFLDSARSELDLEPSP